MLKVVKYACDAVGIFFHMFYIGFTDPFLTDEEETDRN